MYPLSRAQHHIGPEAVPLLGEIGGTQLQNGRAEVAFPTHAAATEARFDEFDDTPQSRINHFFLLGRVA